MRILSSRRGIHLTEDKLREGCRFGADSHADVSVAGKHAKILSYVDGQTCTVHPFHEGYKPKKNIKVVNVAFAYDSDDGITYLLVVNHCLDFTNDMNDSLFCTNQIRANNIIVEDTPKCYDMNGTSRQAIIIPDKNIILPLHMHGPMMFLPVRYPTDTEVEECERIELTSMSGWDPYNECTSTLSALDVFPMTNHNELHTMLENKAHIQAIKTTTKGELTPSYLSTLWNISLDTAKRTLQSTKQKSMHILKNGLTRRRMANKSRLDFVRLSGYLSDFASDTFFSNVVSLRGNKCVQLFSNRGNYVMPYPMATKSEAPRALHRFFLEVGLPNSILTDGALELKKSEWVKLCRRNEVTQKTTEPYCPWQNFAEPNGGAIKRAVRRLMRTTNTPVRLWDYCWEYLCAIKRFTATSNIHLDNKTPHEKIHGNMPNITECPMLEIGRRKFRF